MIFLYFWEEKKGKNTHTHTEKLSNNNGNEFCKRHRSVGQRMEIANTLHTILCKNEPTKRKNPKSKQKIE